MKTIFEHIDTIQGQPHHIRKGIAFTAAVVGAGLIGLVWLVTSLGTGAFAVQGSSFADATGRPSADVAGAGASDSHATGLAGAAAAISDPNAPAHIEIIDTSVSAKPVKKAEQTTIPF